MARLSRGARKLARTLSSYLQHLPEEITSFPIKKEKVLFQSLLVADPPHKYSRRSTMTIVRIDSGSHILVFPFPAQGHMLSILDLTHQLAVRGVFITILVTPKNLPALSSLLAAHPTTVTTFVLTMPPHPFIPPDIENVKDLPEGGSKSMMIALRDLHNPLLDWFRNHPNPPVAIVSNMFLGWTHRLACQLGIRRYTFSPSGALALSVIFSLWHNLPKRADQQNDNEIITFPKIPNSPEYPWWQLSPLYRSYVEGDPTSEFLKDGLCANFASWGIIINSFTELEQVYIDHLKQELGHDRVFTVGPLLPPINKSIERGGHNSNDVVSWLDTCASQSVVYVCFGSQAVLTNNQTAEVAMGLEKSLVNFVWSVKEPTVGHAAEEYGKIPAGFEDRVAGRGLVVRGWAPQVAILNHDAVGTFLTHCGWNSIMEAVAVGVLMLLWPMRADQFCNAKLLRELNVGVKAVEGPTNVPDSGELAELFSRSVSEKTCLERKRTKMFGRAAKEGMCEYGSSLKDLERLVAGFSC